MSIEINQEKIKKALLDSKFRSLYPELKKEIDQWIENPGCKCNIPLYNTILSDISRLKLYFGQESVVTEPILEIPGQVNHWSIFNGHIDKLNDYLQSLSPGPKQIAIARWQDQVTVIVNDPEFND